MTFRVKDAVLRGIYDSRGRVTAEVDLRLFSGAFGRGSTPQAIAPGRLERFRGSIDRVGRHDGKTDIAKALNGLCGRSFSDQADFDRYLSDRPEIGTTITVALSLAFARAAARQNALPLPVYLSRLAGTEAAIFPRPMINVISGGIHDPGGRNPFQQIFTVPRTDDLIEALDAAWQVYRLVENHLGRDGTPVVHSASSGMLAIGLSHVEAVQLVADAIERTKASRMLDIGFDVASEHLRTAGGNYRIGRRKYDSDQLLHHLQTLADEFPVSMIEDPFDADDRVHWQRLMASHGSRIHILGDDLFATHAARIDGSLANGILLKLDQVGNVTGLIDAARRAKSEHMALCQSHRSGETEDTSMCDLAVAVGADFIKVGGPRRGDRIIRINQLLRLHEQSRHGGGVSKSPPNRRKAIPMSKAAEFKKLLLADEILQVPSAYDCLSAKVIAKAGFPVVHMTGSGTSASLIGMPDVGFTTSSEMAAHAKRIAMSVDIPVIADADTGYGNALNVIRTIREFEASGIVGVHLEDQVTPKRCGHLEGKTLISCKEMVGKIRAAVFARVDPDFTIIARTDALEHYGMEEALRRSRAYVEAGADCIFLEAPRSREDLEYVRAQLDVPLLANMVEGGKTPWFTARELEAMGYNIVIYPLSGWYGAAVLLRDAMAALRDEGTTQDFWKRNGLHMSFEELFDIFDYGKVEEWEREYVVRSESKTAVAAE